MALALVNQTRIAILSDRTAAYSLILAASAGVAEASQAVLVFPYGVNTAVTANAIASTATDTTGQFTSPVNLYPGCPYVVTCPNDGSWAATLFTAGAIAGPVITNGASSQAISGVNVGITGTTSVVVTSPLVELGETGLVANDGVVRKSDLQSALTALAALVAPYVTGATVTAPTATASTVTLTE